VQVEFLPTADLIGRGRRLDCVTVEHAVEPAPQPQRDDRW